MNYSKEPYGYFLGAHRGGSQEHPENTMTAFMRAKRLGVSFVEMDVCLTKDKKVVVVHDYELSRIAGVSKKINQYNYDELPKIQDKVRLHFSGEIFDTTAYPDRSFPLFEDVVKRLGNTPINVELKSKEMELIDLTHEIIERHDKKSNIVWGSLNRNAVMKIDQLDPIIPRFAAPFELPKLLL